MTPLFSNQDVTTLSHSNIFLLAAVRSWHATRAEGSCPEDALSTWFSANLLQRALPPFLTAMNIMHINYTGIKPFNQVFCPTISNDEAVVLTLFAAAQADEATICLWASNMVTQEQSIALALAAKAVSAVLVSDTVNRPDMPHGPFLPIAARYRHGASPH